MRDIPEKYINRKVTVGFLLLMALAAVGFGIGYSGIVHYLQNTRKEDPLGQRLMALNELIFKLQETDGAARNYRVTGRIKDLRDYQNMQDSVFQTVERLPQYFADSNYLAHIDTLKNLLEQKQKQTQEIFELSDIHRYRLRYGKIIPLLPDSISLQISKITWSSIHIASPDSLSVPEDQQKGFFGRIASFISGKKEEIPQPENTPEISQIVDSSKITRTVEEPVLKEVKQQLQIIEEQDKQFSRLLAQREQKLVLLGTRLTNTIRTFVKKLEEQAILESFNQQQKTDLLKESLFRKIIILGFSALLIFLSFILWIGHDLRKNRRFKEDLMHSREKIESLMKVKERFLANMSHEIRTPLTAIIGFSEIIKEESEPAGIIHNSALHLLSLVNDILDYSTLQEGKLTLHKESILAGELLDETYNTFLAKARQKQLQFLVTENDKNITFTGDKTRIKQVLFNLTGNAIKFTEQGKVWLSFTEESETLLFEIGDTGPGVPDNQINNIFNEFTQLDTASSNGKGTGLGLAISKKIIEAMGGEIGITNHQEIGSLFWFRIPYIRELKQPIQKNTAEHPRIEQNRILVVDDDPLIQKLIRGYIGHKIEVESFQSATDALQHLKEESYSLVITDFRMPKLNGAEFIKKIREKYDIPVLLLSAAVDERHTFDEIKKYKDVFVMPKPFSRHDLIKKIKFIRTNEPQHAIKEKKFPDTHPGLYDLSSIISFTGDDHHFLTSVTATFIEDTQKNLNHLSSLIHHKKHGDIADQAHKMQTGFRQFGIKEGSTILKGIEVLGKKPGSTPELKRGLKRLKSHWHEVEKSLKEKITDTAQ